jgi:hypothetical protein
MTPDITGSFPPAVAAAFVNAQRKLKAITKDSTNPHFKNTYASLDAIIEAVRPVLLAEGFGILQGTTAPDRDETGRVTAFTVVTTLVHTSGTMLSTSVVMPLAKSDPQGAGGALTYGRRYGLSALLCLATDDDDDAERAGHAEEHRPKYGSTATAGDTRMPFGKTKGKRLGDLSDAELSSARTWMAETDAKKFATLITAIEEVQENNRLAASDSDG